LDRLITPDEQNLWALRTKFIIPLIAGFIILGSIGFYQSASAGLATVPDAVTDLTLEVVTDTEVELTWTIPFDGGSTITGYVIQNKVNSGGINTLETSFGDDTTDSYSDASLSPGDSVRYRIAPINAIGQAPFSNIPSAVMTIDDPNLDVILQILADIAELFGLVTGLQTQIDDIELTPGPAGATGATGMKGMTGATAATGMKGMTGAAGADGTDGATGATGMKGMTGASGATGMKGMTGASGAGATGPAGADVVFTAQTCVIGTFMIGIETDGTIVCTV